MVWKIKSMNGWNEVEDAEKNCCWLCIEHWLRFYGIIYRLNIVVWWQLHTIQMQMISIAELESVNEKILECHVSSIELSAFMFTFYAFLANKNCQNAFEPNAMNNMHADDKLSISLLKTDSERFWIEKKNYVTAISGILACIEIFLCCWWIAFFFLLRYHLFWDVFPTSVSSLQSFFFYLWYKADALFQSNWNENVLLHNFFSRWFKSNLFHVSFKAIAIPFRFLKADCIEMPRKCILPIWENARFSWIMNT